MALKISETFRWRGVPFLMVKALIILKEGYCPKMSITRAETAFCQAGVKSAAVRFYGSFKIFFMR